MKKTVSFLMYPEHVRLLSTEMENHFSSFKHTNFHVKSWKMHLCYYKHYLTEDKNIERKKMWSAV